MKIIEVINEHNLSTEEINKLPIHKKVRGIVLVNKKTLVCVEENSYGIVHLLGLPGGGIEKDEGDMEAFRREVKEETGYEIEDVLPLGIIKLVKKDQLSVTNCYIAKTKGKRGNQAFTEEERKVGARSLELSFNDTVFRVSEEYDKNPNNNSLRSILILKEFVKLNQN